MTPETLLRLDESFATYPDLVAKGGVTEREIDAAEQCVGVRFDPGYRAFLARYGGAIVGSLPVLGLRRAEEMGKDTWSVVDETLRFRGDRWPGTERWAIVSVDLSGNPIGLASDGQVWLSDHDTWEILLLAPTFEDFLVGLLDKRY